MVVLARRQGPKAEGCHDGDKDSGGGDQQADAQAVDEAGRLGDEGAEDGDGKGAAGLAGGVEDPAGGSGPLGGHALQHSPSWIEGNATFTISASNVIVKKPSSTAASAARDPVVVAVAGGPDTAGRTGAWGMEDTA
ncbi:hypothetical protein [Streptomyces sp. NPDC046371]|uniref:hypothetical protein n=1 Tax=unclassified Streptomyces TaxID=2593676 RepID=UPI0033DF86C6